MRTLHAPPWPLSSKSRRRRRGPGACSLLRPGALLAALILALALHSTHTVSLDIPTQTSSGPLVSSQQQPVALAGADVAAGKAAEGTGQDQGQGQGQGQAQGQAQGQGSTQEQGKGEGQVKKEGGTGPLHGRVGQFQKELLRALLNRLPLVKERKGRGTPGGGTGPEGQQGEEEEEQIVDDAAVLLNALRRSGAELRTRLQTAVVSSVKGPWSTVAGFFKSQPEASVSGESKESVPTESGMGGQPGSSSHGESKESVSESVPEETEKEAPAASGESDSPKEQGTNQVNEVERGGPAVEGSGIAPATGIAAEASTISATPDGASTGEEQGVIAAADVGNTAAESTSVAVDAVSRAPGENSTVEGVAGSGEGATAGEPRVEEDKSSAEAGPTSSVDTEESKGGYSSEPQAQAQGQSQSQPQPQPQSQPQPQPQPQSQSQPQPQPQPQPQLQSQSQSQSQLQVQSQSQSQSQSQAQPVVRLQKKAQARPQAQRKSQEGMFANLRAEALAQVPTPSPHELDVALRFIQGNIQFPGTKQCGAWSRSYAQLQRETRSGLRKPARYIFYAGQEGQGMGDRLLGLVTTFVVGLLSNRALIVEDDVLSTAFEPSMIDWRMGPDFAAARAALRNTIEVESPDKEPKNRTYEGLGGSYVRFLLKNGTPLKRRSNAHRFAAATSFVRFPRETIYEYFHPFQDAPIFELCTNGGVLTQALVARDTVTAKMLRAMGMRLATAYPCILRFLLRPVSQVWRLLAPVVVQLQAHRNVPTFCVHMRVTDAESWDPSGMPVVDRVRRSSWKLLDQLLKCVQIVVNRLPVSQRRMKRMRLFFMTESLALRRTAQKMRKNVIVSPIVPRHVAFQPKSEAERRQNIWDTTMDWLLFSMCQYHMIDKSGFSKTAMAYSLTHKALYTNPRLRFWSPGLGRCDGKNPDSLEGVGAFWSGL